MKKVHILGGGTVFHVRPHLALSAPAYGQTARRLHTLAREKFAEMGVHLHLTRMAERYQTPDEVMLDAAGFPTMETNADVAAFLDLLVADLDTKVIFLNTALCDFDVKSVTIPGDEYAENTRIGKDQPRLESKWTYDLRLEASEKLVKRIREKRKDIFLVAFKATSGLTEDQQYLKGLGLLKSSSCNLVLANDVKTKVNMIITPEEARYHVTTDREEALRNLVDMAWHRSHLSFTRATVVDGTPLPWNNPLVPSALRTVVNHLVKRGAYKPFRGATVGHFACKVDDNTFLTSIRKSNFNDLEKNGLVLVKTDGPDTVLAYGAKPSVGGQSQRIVFSAHPEFDCIAHAHVPLKAGSTVPVISQREYECGSHECGQNTSSGLKKVCLQNRFGGGWIGVVMLDNHGPNIVFNRSIDPDLVIEFIEANFDLEGKTGGLVSEPAR